MEFLKKLVLLSLPVFLFACKKDPPTKTERVLISAATSLNSRVHYFNTPVLLEQGVGSSTLKLVLKADIDPLIYNGVTLRPGSVFMHDNLAYVSYYQGGSGSMGAVEIIDLRTKGKPKVISQAVFLNADVNGVAYYDSKIYLAEASADIHFSYPAVLEEVKLSSGLLTNLSRRVAVFSQAATDVMVADGKIYVTSSVTGGLTIFDQVRLTRLKQFDHRDARAIMFNKERFVVFCGDPGKLHVYSRFDDVQLLSADIGGTAVPEIKGGIALTDSGVYAATGEGGMYAVSISSGAIRANTPPPVISGVSAYKTLTSSVAAESNYVYVANGEAGVYVYRDQGGALDYLGILQFSSGISASYLKAENNLLFIATGEGKLKILQITP